MPYDADLVTEPEPNPEFFHHRRHCEHHEIAVKAFEKHEELVVATGVDYGPDFYWYTAEFEMGIIAIEPLPPPAE
jgi:hypothetical protein